MKSKEPKALMATEKNENQIQQEVVAEQEHSQEENEEYSDEEENYGSQVKEADFRFDDFINRFARPRVLEACGLALKTFDTNSAYTNHCIVKLLHRIAVDCKMPAMLFQASLFRTFQRILSDTNPNYKELAKFVIYIMRKFVEVAQRNSKIFMELLFWKSPKEAVDLEEGYGSAQQKSQAAKRAWTELQEEELRHLYEEYKSKDIQEMDLVEWIGHNLIDQTRSHRAIKKKLIEMGLVEGPRKFVKHWNEDDEEELRDLFMKHRESDDVLEQIVNRLSTDRSKQSVTKKLLEMGLIQDKKELKSKKPARKSRKKPSETDDDEHSSSDEEGDNIPSTSTKSKTSQAKRKQKGKKSGTKSKKTISKTESIKLLIQVAETDMKEILNWLHESVSDVADDQEQDPDPEGVPLVPVTSEESTAMENELFQNMLRSFGFIEPDSIQEIYWRIPGHLPAIELRNICVQITEAIEGKLTVPETPTETVTQNNNDSGNSSDEEDVFSKVKKFITTDGPEDDEILIKKPTSRRSKTLQQDIQSENLELLTPSVPPQRSNDELLTLLTETQNDITEQNTEDLLADAEAWLQKNSTQNNTIKTSKKNKTRLIMEDSDSDSRSLSPIPKKDNLPTENFDDTNSTGKIKTNKSRILMLDSDSEEETIQTNTPQEENLKTNKSIISSDSESEDGHSKRNRSDESDSEHITNPKTKKAKLILSDDDDE